MAVTETLAQLHLTPKSVALGEAQVDETLSPEQTSQVAEALRQKGFELVMDKKAQIVEDIKQTIITIARAEARGNSESYSTLLAEKLKTDYATLSRLFVAAEGRTIEKFYLLQRIEYVKELIEYGDLSIKEIAWRTGFSSVAHLSRQFKQLTGLTPTAYRDLGVPDRKGLDKVWSAFSSNISGT